MTVWILFILVPSLLGGLMIFATCRVQDKRRLGIVLAILNLLMILGLLLLVYNAGDNAPEVRFNQFVVGGVIGLILGLIALHRQSKLE